MYFGSVFAFASQIIQTTVVVLQTELTRLWVQQGVGVVYHKSAMLRQV